MKRTLLVFYVFLFLIINIFLLSFSPKDKKIGSTGPVVRELIPVDQEITSFLKKWKIPGGAAALVKDGKIVYVRGFGMADEKEVVKPESLFRIASLSKPITAVGIMKLVQEGKLSLRQHVFGNDGILNEAKFSSYADQRIGKITIGHLLNHTAGWDRELSPCGDPMFDPVNIASCMNEPSPAAPSTIIRYMLTKPLDFTPGSRFSYSNFGYTLLGRIIEKVSGLSYETFIKREVLEPMNIHDMELGRNKLCDRRQNEVKYFDKYNEEIPSVCSQGEKVPYPYGGFNLEAMDAHGGWIANVADLSRFMKGVELVLNPSTIHAMLAPSAASPGYAQGWFVNAKRSWWHTGCLAGSSSMMAHVQDNISWVLLFNGNPQSNAYFADMDRLMWRALSKIKKWPEKEFVS